MLETQVSRAPAQEKPEVPDSDEPLRPEAKRMMWHELCSPEKRAVSELLTLFARGINAVDTGRSSLRSNAHRHKKTHEQKISTSFFIAGERGAGKTTVLLSAAYATETDSRHSEFLRGVSSIHINKDQEELQDDERCQLQQTEAAIDAVCDSICWLAPLNMEFLPEGTNLLTTLLVRVRNALTGAVQTPEDGDGERTAFQGRGQHRTPGPPPTLLEEGEGLFGSWDELDGLLARATLMWEGASTEIDVRKRVQPQIEAAETFVQIQQQLRAALDRACEQLGRSRRKPTLVLVLPIDNIDRSAHKVPELLKLVRMIYCPTLWYVITGTEEDLELFLESSLRRELSADLAASQALPAHAGLEQLLASARRQSKATMLAALAPGQRVVVGKVPAAEALEFKLEGGKPLRHYLRKLKIDWEEDAHPGSKGLCLLDLMKTKVRLPTPRRELTQAGHDALRLPVRNLVDLWQAARKRCCAQRELELPHTGEHDVRDPQRKDMEQPIELVTEMLRRAAFESNLPDWACSYLCHRVVYHNELGQPCLDFRDNPLRWRLGISVKDRIDVQSASPDGESPLLMSTLVLHDSYGYTAQLHDPEEPNHSVEIEPAVSSWLMLLQDLLNQRCGPRVVIAKDTQWFDDKPLLVQTEHRILLLDHESFQVKLTWTTPVFETFFDFERIRLQWQECLKELQNPMNQGDRCLPLCMIAWIDCVLSTAIYQPRKSDAPSTSTWRPPWRRGDEYKEPDVNTFQDYAEEVLQRARDAYDVLIVRRKEGTAGRRDAVRSWLERGLPLLQLPEYLVGSKPPFVSTPQSSKLEAYWENHSRHLTWKRYETVRNALSETEGARAMTRALNERLRVRDYFELQEHQHKMLDRWFQTLNAAAPSTATHNGPQLLSAERFDPVTKLNPPSMQASLHPSARELGTH